MRNLKVTTNLAGMDELDASIARAKKVLEELETAVGDIFAAFRKVGVTIDQPPADTEG